MTIDCYVPPAGETYRDALKLLFVIVALKCMDDTIGRHHWISYFNLTNKEILNTNLDSGGKKEKVTTKVTQ